MENRYIFRTIAGRVSEWKEVTQYTAFDYMIRALLELRSTYMITIHKEGYSI